MYPFKRVHQVLICSQPDHFFFLDRNYSNINAMARVLRADFSSMHSGKIKREVSVAVHWMGWGHSSMALILFRSSLNLPRWSVQMTRKPSKLSLRLSLMCSGRKRNVAPSRRSASEALQAWEFHRMGSAPKYPALLFGQWIQDEKKKIYIYIIIYRVLKYVIIFLEYIILVNF